MKISKHLHSCLLVEEQDKTILFDPGIFTYQEKALDLNQIGKLDYLLITHEHSDHLHVPFVQEILAKFPTVKIITNNAIVTQLAKENITMTYEGDSVVKVEQVPHERVFDRDVPKNVLFEIFGRLVHPGDSMSFTTNKEILALPLLGPSWMITQAAEKAVALSPKTVIPIHDYHWRDTSRKEFYKRLLDFFKTKNIDFKVMETGEEIEI